MWFADTVFYILIDLWNAAITNYCTIFVKLLWTQSLNHETTQLALSKISKTTEPICHTIVRPEPYYLERRHNDSQFQTGTAPSADIARKIYYSYIFIHCSKNVISEFMIRRIYKNLQLFLFPTYTWYNVWSKKNIFITKVTKNNNIHAWVTQLISTFAYKYIIYRNIKSDFSAISSVLVFFRSILLSVTYSRYARSEIYQFIVILYINK